MFRQAQIAALISTSSVMTPKGEMVACNSNASHLASIEIDFILFPSFWL